MAVGDGHVLFIASDGTGSELWITDGTMQHVCCETSIRSSDHHQAFNTYPDGGGRVLFTANDGAGSELWITDGTSAGTVLLKDIHPTGSPVGTS